MKSKHLAKADFIRRLRELAAELYELSDFTSKHLEILNIYSLVSPAVASVFAPVEKYSLIQMRATPKKNDKFYKNIRN